MAKMVSLSRARFYDLVRRGVFLQPVYSLATRRPCYIAEMQQQNLDARQSGIGCNGEYVLFYERPQTPRRVPSIAPRLGPQREEHAGLIDGLRSLGLENVTKAQVDEALATSFPNGTGGLDEAVILRTVYRHFRRLGRG
jgi:hypothetical protein